MNEKAIWDYLFPRIGNSFGVAGLMGNLFAESGLEPTNLQGAYEKKLGYTDSSYTAAVDSGRYPADSFIHDGAGYGLAQWAYWSRKEKLLEHARACGKSIGDLDTQLGFLWEEIQGRRALTNRLMLATSVQEASDVVLTQYERPLDQGDGAKAKRASYGQKYYDMFAGQTSEKKTNEGSENMATNNDKYKLSTGTHYISNSGSDENGAYTGGTAGDQTGKEWQLKAWYNRPWTVVLRYPDQAVANKIADLGIAAALNNKIGYDQNQRTTYWTQLSKVGYDPSKITVACEEDCTAGVSANVRAAGYIYGIKALQSVPICSSRNMKAEFTKAGFKALTASKYLTSGKYLLPGDILLYESHHAATNVTCGASVRNEWHPAETASAPMDGIEPYVGEITIELPSILIKGGSVNVRKGPGTSYGTLGIAKANEYLHYFGYTNPDGWFLVEYNQQTGWVSGKYGELVG